MAGGEPRYRILLVTNWIGWAGAETQLGHLALGLRAAGHSVTMLATAGILVDPAPLREAGIEVAELGARDRWAKLRALGRLARRARRADLVHCTGWDATLWGRLAAIAARRPALFTEHTPGREHQETGTGGSAARVIGLHNRLLDRFTYAAIVVGEWQRALLRREGVRGPIVRIPNAVPVAELRRRAERGPSRAELGLPEDVPVVVQVARFAPQKGQAAVLRAVEALRERHGDVRVLFVGLGETEAAVRAEAEARGAGWASFLGSREDVPGLLRLADVAVLPSTGEGLPMSLIEAIVLGTPVVATAVGDVGWLIDSSGAGVHVPAGEEAAFERALGELLADPARRAELAAAGLAAAPAFDAPLMVERYEAVFRAAVEGAPVPANA